MPPLFLNNWANKISEKCGVEKSENVKCDLEGSSASHVPNSHFTDGSEKFNNLPKDRQLLNGRADHWPVLIWGLLIWCVRILWVDGAGTRSQLCPVQLGSLGSPQPVGKGISRELRPRVAPTHQRAVLSSPLVFGHLQDIDRRILYSELKKPWTYLWLQFSILPGLLRYNLHNSNLFSFSLQFFEFWKMHRVTHCHTIKIVNSPVTPNPFVCLVSSFPPPDLTPSFWQPLI